MDASNSSGYALLAALDGQQLPDAVGQAVQLLATVLVQDLEGGPDGVLRIARKVAPDRVISTVDPQARQGHKTNHRGFDGYEGHVAIDPDSEIITATGVTPGNTGDADPARDLIAELLEPGDDQTPAADDAAVYGDCAYGTGEMLDQLHSAGIEAMTKVQAHNAPAGRFTKDHFTIDLGAQQVTCPNGVTTERTPTQAGSRSSTR
jgi:hypothetical protein